MPLRVFWPVELRRFVKGQNQGVDQRMSRRMWMNCACVSPSSTFQKNSWRGSGEVVEVECLSGWELGPGTIGEEGIQEAMASALHSALGVACNLPSM
jgi:hypothetical protein